MIDFQPGEFTTGGLLPDTIIWTPEIERLNRFIIESLRMQSRGCAVVGQQCNGKSFATKYLMSLLPESLGHTIAVARWHIKKQEQGAAPTERAFVQERMLQSECDSVAHRDIAVLWRRLFKHLADKATAAGSRWIVIMVDEAQNLLLQEYQRLIYCFNSLEEINVKPFFMLTGQPELLNVSSSWKEMNGMQVIGRFFTRKFGFRGIDLAGIGQVLECLDERVTVAGEQVPLSAKLFPVVAGSDWGLGKWAPHFAAAAETLRTTHNLPAEKTLYLPMQMIRSAVLLLLHRCMTMKIDPRTISAAMVLTALQDTGFASTLDYYLDTFSGRLNEGDS